MTTVAALLFHRALRGGAWFLRVLRGGAFSLRPIVTEPPQKPFDIARDVAARAPWHIADLLRDCGAGRRGAREVAIRIVDVDVGAMRQVAPDARVVRAGSAHDRACSEPHFPMQGR